MTFATMIWTVDTIIKTGIASRYKALEEDSTMTMVKSSSGTAGAAWRTRRSLSKEMVARASYALAAALAS